MTFSQANHARKKVLLYMRNGEEDEAEEEKEGRRERERERERRGGSHACSQDNF